MTTKDTTKDFYMLVRKGFVQRMPATLYGQNVTIWPVAESHKDAPRLARWMIANGRASDDVVPARIGSVEGETLEGNIKGALEDGCVAMACVAGWTEDGPTWKYIDFADPEDDESEPGAASGGP